MCVSAREREGEGRWEMGEPEREAREAREVGEAREAREAREVGEAREAREGQKKEAVTQGDRVCVCVCVIAC